MSDLYDNFRNSFKLVVADTTKLLEEVYRIRYQVLCIEQRLPGFDPALYPDQMEKDDYDSHSSHILLLHISSEKFIGTVRLILPDSSNPKKLLPVELYGQLDPTLCDVKALPRQQTAEISRFLVISQFDRRKGDRRQQDEEIDGEKRQVQDRRSSDRRQDEEIDGGKIGAQDRRSSDRRSSLSIGLVLMAGVMRMSVKYDIRHWLSVADPALNKLMGFYGLNFNPIGPPVDYHGIRRPYYVKVEDAVERMYEERRDAWEVVTGKGKYKFNHYSLMEYP